jgi:hypothetical protein
LSAIEATISGSGAKAARKPPDCSAIESPIAFA